jgi:hypothetical protein
MRSCESGKGRGENDIKWKRTLDKLRTTGELEEERQMYTERENSREGERNERF